MSSIKLPIFRSDHSFSDESQRPFGDITMKIERDFDKPWASDWDDDFKRMYDDFFQLKPAPMKTGLDRLRSTDRGSPEMLDDKTRESLFVEDSSTGGRKFQISFAVRDYHPKDISVKLDEHTLTVEAKHEDVKDGMKSTKEFNRKIEIPKEVDPEKLTSRLSSDGVLTIEAPVPPRYGAIPNSKPLTPPLRSSPQTAYMTTGARQSPQSSPADSTRYATNYPNYPYTPSTSSQTSTLPYQDASYQYKPPQYQTASYQAPQQYPQSASQAPYSPSYPAQPQTTMPRPPQYMQVVGGAPPTPPLGVPTYYTDVEGKKMELLVDLGQEFGPDDLVVKVDGARLLVEASKEVSIGARRSKSSMSKEFDLDGDINPQTITANFMPDGKLRITAKAV